METRKRLGRGLEDISHLFISKRPSTESAARPIPSPAENMAQGSPKRFCLVSAVRGYTVAFWAMNLAAALSRGGKRCLLIEGHTGSDSLSEMLNLPGVHASLGEFLNHDRQLTHGDPGGVRLLAFQIRVEEFRSIKAEERDILFEILKREEEASDYVVTTFETDPLEPAMMELLRANREAVVIGQADDPVPTYQQIKALCYHHPGVNIGLILHGVASESEAAPIVERLGAAARRFLDKPISLYGILPPDPLLERSLAARVPVFNLGTGSEISRRFAAATGELVQAMTHRAGSDEPARLMFERIQTGMV